MTASISDRMTHRTNVNRRAATTLVAVESAVLALILGAIGLLLLGAIGMIAGLVIAVGAVLLVGARATSVALARAKGRPADSHAYARYHNLVDGLCVAAGVPKPRLYVAPDDAPNAMTCGRNQGEATLIVTEGLLQKLSRIELEGVLAHEITHIRALDILPATLAVTLAAPLGAWAVKAVVDPTREPDADANAASLTRYPPGLLAALEKLRDDPARLAPRSRTIAHLWLAPVETGGATPGGPSGPPLDERIEALREL